MHSIPGTLTTQGLNDTDRRGTGARRLAASVILGGPITERVPKHRSSPGLSHMNHFLSHWFRDQDRDAERGAVGLLTGMCVYKCTEC